MRHLSPCRLGLGECGWRGINSGGDAGGEGRYCVCAYCSFVKNAFVVLKVHWAPLLFLFLLFLFSPSSILPHTFEPLCGIVRRSWLGSLLCRPYLPPVQLARDPEIRRCQPERGSEAGSPESSAARGSWLRGPELLLSQLMTRRFWDEVGRCFASEEPRKGRG